MSPDPQASGPRGDSEQELRRALARLEAEKERLERDCARKRERIEELAARTHGLAATVESLANTDPLTGFATRRSFESTLAGVLSEAARHEARVAALLVGSDGTKHINESLGHSSGDLVLRAMARQLAGALRGGDPVCRVGGDEFLVLLADADLEDAVGVAERVRLAIADHAMEISGEPLEVSASVAVALVPPSVVSIDEILDGLHAALAESKRRGPNRVVVATDERGRRSREAFPSDEYDLLLERGSLRALAQSIRELGTGRVVGYEMLSRGPRGPYENPVNLFRLARERGATTQLDLRCFRTCVLESRQLVDLGRPAGAFRIHVNLMPSTLVDTPVVRILELFDQAGGPERFCVELSEQQFLGAPDYLYDAVVDLKQSGVSIALDDVGFGKSSLEALIKLHPDVIKIAREAVDSADRFTSRRRELERLLRATMPLATTLVAEGIEREGERRLCHELGVPLGQGYLWDRPQDVAEVRRGVARLPRAG